MTTTLIETPVDEPPATERDLPWSYLLLGVLVAYLPFVFLGYGTDLDVASVLRAGESALDGDYEMVRSPGAAPFEAATRLLDRAGGPILVNLVAVGFGLLALWSVHRLLVRDGARWPVLATAVLAVNPWFWVASTSLGDFTWALGLGLAGAVAARSDRRVLAGVLFGLSIGCRPSAGLLALAWLVAERTGDADDRGPWSDTLRTAVPLAVVGVACFVPSWLSVDRSFDFLSDDLGFAGWGAHAGRFLVKNLATATLPGAAVLIVGGRRLLSAVPRWRSSTLVRFAVLAIVLCEVAFLRFPFKPLHLLPVVAAVALLVGCADLDRRRWISILLAAQLVAAFVGTTIAAPDTPDHADSGRLSIRIADGVVVNDLRCRLEDLDRGEWPDGDSQAERAEATARAEANFHCQRDAWRDS